MSYSTRNRKVLENLNNASEERTDVLEKQLTEAKLIAEEADKKYDEVKAATWLYQSSTPLLHVLTKSRIQFNSSSKF